MGKSTLLSQRQSGLKNRLVMLEVSGMPLLLHDEPVLEDAE